MEQTTPEKPKRKPRKTSPRTKGVHKNSAASKRLKELWADPEWRLNHWAKVTSRGFSYGQGTRAGVPDGMRKDEAMARWAKARASAKKTIEVLKVKTNLLGEDDGKAEDALETALTIMRGPNNDQKMKLAAARLVLEFTKAKPASKSIVAVDDAEAWLTKIAEDDDKEADEGKAPSDA